MNVEKFIGLFTKKVEELYTDLIIVDRGKNKKLNNYEHTYLIGIALYNAVKDYNKESEKESKNNNNFQKIFITPEERVSNGLRSDFSLKNEKDKVELAIEHEHDRRDKNHKKGIEGNYNKLQAITGAKEKLLICYLNSEDYDKDFKKYIYTIFKKEDKIYILIGTKKNDNDFTDSMEYKKLICPNGSDCNASED